MRDRRHVSNKRNAQSYCFKCPERCVSPCPWALNVHFYFPQSRIHRFAYNSLDCCCCRIRSSTTRTLESNQAGRTPVQRISTLIGDGYQCVIKCSRYIYSSFCRNNLGDFGCHRLFAFCCRCILLCAIFLLESSNGHALSAFRTCICTGPLSSRR